MNSINLHPKNRVAGPGQVQAVDARANDRSDGFTLVELLVVIGIIALLVSILLPTLASARRSAQTVACLANMRSLGQAMTIYVSENNGYIPGSPYTTGREYANKEISGNKTTDGENLGIFDWMSPLARVNKMNVNWGTSEADHVKRYIKFADDGPFQCPSNRDGVISVPYSGSGYVDITLWPAVTPLSYHTSLPFMLMRNYDTGSAQALNAQQYGTSYPWRGGGGQYLCLSVWNNPIGYAPKINKIGNPAKKIFLSEGSRYVIVGYSRTPQLTVDYDANPYGSFGGMFADQPPVVPYSKSGVARRIDASTGGTSGSYGDAYRKAPPMSADPMLLAYRHGSQKAWSFGNRRMNVLFFDGHAETMSDGDLMNPTLWFPKGCELTVNSAQFYDDVMSGFFNGVSYTTDKPYVVRE